MALEEKFFRVDFGSSVEIGNDTVHPTQDGYDLMAEIAYAAIRAAVP